MAKDKFSQRVRRVMVKHGVLEDAKADEALAIADKSDTTSFTDAGLSPSTQYCYKVRAVNIFGGSTYTSVVCTTAY